MEERIEVARFGKGRLEKWGGTFILHVKGEPYERGFQHGYLLGKKIDETVSRGLTSAAAVCGKAVGGSIKAGFEKLERGMEEARGFMPYEFREEIRGLSDALAKQGSRLDFQDMLMWNLMYDSWCFYAHPEVGDPSADFYRSPYPETIGCSSFPLGGRRQATANCCLARTWTTWICLV
ncbi:MAG: hypothetical protein NT061_00320 [Spirochaetes bacterium]|nr:hypothetical protein [Spirochaetota bacterium]